MCCSPGSPCFEWIKALGPSLVALVIGVIAAHITWTQKEVARSQKEVAQAKLKLDLFERRYNIFHQTWVSVSEVVQTGTREQNLGFGTPFNNYRPEAAFLFGKDIEAFIDELVHNWAELHALEAERDGQGPDRMMIIERMRKLRDWFFEQASKGVKDRFAPYLDFANWK